MWAAYGGFKLAKVALHIHIIVRTSKQRGNRENLQKVPNQIMRRGAPSSIVRRSNLES